MDRLQLYHRLPYPLKVAAATVRGAQLRRWRYGPDTERWADEALARDRFTPAQWKAYRDARLERLLHLAATRVPAYRELWRDRAGDPTRLADWPVLEKVALRERPDAFLRDDLDPATLYPEGTSGTSGTPLRLWFRRDTARLWYALVEARTRRWHGVDRRDPWAILGGQLVTRPGRNRPPYWVWNVALRQLYLSAFHLGPASAFDMVRAMERHGVRHLYGYTAALDDLAAALEGLGPRAVDAARAVGLGFVTTNAEPLFAHQRERIERVFGAPVRENYGMAELVAAASECEHGGLHLWPEVGALEVLDDDGRPVAPGEPGELIATGLLGDAQPLVRYRTGDRLTLAPPDAPCPCGRPLPRILRVEGRHEDAVITPDGRRVNRYDAVFKNPAQGTLPVREAQIIQTGTRDVLVRLVPGSGWDDATESLIRDRMFDRLGTEMTITIRTVPSLPRGANGKFQMVWGLDRWRREGEG